jgi:hypothetical protein
MTPVTCNFARGCTTCRKVIHAGEPHRFDKATNSRYHLKSDCLPDDEIATSAQTERRQNHRHDTRIDRPVSI